MEKICVEIGENFEVCKNNKGEAWIEKFPEDMVEAREIDKYSDIKVYVDGKETMYYETSNEVPPSISKELIEFIKEATKPNDRNIDLFYNLSLEERNIIRERDIDVDYGNIPYMIESMLGGSLSEDFIEELLDFAEEHRIYYPEDDIDKEVFLDEEFMYDFNNTVEKCANKYTANMGKFVECLDLSEEYIYSIYEDAYLSLENEYAYRGINAICKAIEEYPEDFKREFGNNTYQKVKDIMC